MISNCESVLQYICHFCTSSPWYFILWLCFVGWQDAVATKNTNWLKAWIMPVIFGNRRLQSVGFIKRISVSFQVSADTQSTEIAMVTKMCILRTHGIFSTDTLHAVSHAHKINQGSVFLLTFHVEVLVVVTCPQVCMLNEVVTLSLLLHMAFSGFL